MSPSADEVYNYYGERAEPFLTALYNAAERFAAEHADTGIQVWVNGKDAEGRVGSAALITISREMPPDTVWILSIGFGSGNDLLQGIDFKVRSGFPPLHIPVRVQWHGQNRFGQDDRADEYLAPIVLTRTGVSWDGRHWHTADEFDADWVVRQLFHRTLLHASLGAAEEAAPDSRWRKVGESPKPIRGGQGFVWKVRDRDDPHGPLYALKEMRYAKSQTSTAYQRFVREIETLNALRHPNIVQVIAYHIPDVDDGTDPFYVMLWADSTLRHARDLAGSVEKVLEIGVALADALAAAHESSVIHRDVKPENVLRLGDEATPTLADFGICYLERDDEEGRLTKTEAETVGTDDYVGPELMGGRATSLDGRVDVYSLGKTLYAALAGGRVFPLWHYHDERFDLRRQDTRPAVQHFYGVLAYMVAEKPEQRFRTMAHCREQLTRALEAVHNFEPYRDGMYGGGATSREIARRLSSALRDADEASRRDVTREAVDEAVEHLDRIATTSTRDIQEVRLHPALSEQRAAAQAAADRLLAVALPMVVANEVRGYTRLMSELAEPLEEGHRSRANDEQHAIRRAASVATHYGVAVLAWRLERWEHLKQVTTRYSAHPHAFAYLDVADGHSMQTWDWIVSTLRSSEVLQATDERTSRQLDGLAESAAGVLAIGYVVSLPAQERATAFETGLPPVDFPALYFGEWVNTLARRLRLDPQLEREFAGGVYGITPEQLRADCRTATPSLARAMAEHRRTGRRAGGEFLFSDDSEWIRWCGGRAS